MTKLQEKFEKTLKPKLQTELRLASPYQVPKLEKVVVNMGVGRALTGLDKQQRDTTLAEIDKLLRAVTGQKPETRQARRSIAGFKLREGDLVGLRVTLRGKRMYDFVERVVNLVFPRIRDFQGIQLKNVDEHGILNFGLKEHIVFPELMQEEFRRLYGVEFVFVPTTRKREQALALYRQLGFPLKKDK